MKIARYSMICGAGTDALLKVVEALATPDEDTVLVK